MRIDVIHLMMAPPPSCDDVMCSMYHEVYIVCWHSEDRKGRTEQNVLGMNARIFMEKDYIS